MAGRAQGYNLAAMHAQLPIQHDVSLQPHNTFGIAARARSYLAVDSLACLQALHADPALARLPRLVLGGGSNIVLTGDFPGLVLHMRNRGMEVLSRDQEATLVRVAAGENWHGFVLWSLEQGLGGLENLALIPGSVGAAPIQNIGAYGVEMQERMHSLRVFDPASATLRTLTREQCRFGYRDSIFKHAQERQWVVWDVSFSFAHAWRPNISYPELAAELAVADPAAEPSQPDARAICQAVIAIRQRKLPDPARIGNAGSFFKNPVVAAAQHASLLARHPRLVSYAQRDGSFKLAAGWLIDQCGWKGKSLGCAGIHERQALVLVNRGGASGSDILALAQAVRQDVLQRFGVTLEPEPVLV